MPVITEAHAAAEAVVQAVRNGTALRASMSGISWGDVAPYSIAANAATFTKSESRHYTLLDVTASAPATKVAEKAQKPEVVTATNTEVPMAKYAGWASTTAECLVYVPEAERLIADVLLSQVVQAVDVDIVTALSAKSTTVTVASSVKGSAALLEAQAALIGKGAVPRAILVNPTDYAKLLGQTTSLGFLNFSSVELGTSGQLFGMALVPTAAVTAGTAYLVDPRGVLVAEHVESPLLFVSAMSTKNEIELVADVFAAVGVASASAVAKVALTF